MYLPRMNGSEKKTIVLGASPNPARYSYMAVQLLQENGNPVIAIGKAPGNIGEIPIITGVPSIREVDTITIYLNPHNQEFYYDYILGIQPHRIIFNPGAENPVLAAMAKRKGIMVLEACTLVLLHTGQY